MNPFINPLTDYSPQLEAFEFQPQVASSLEGRSAVFDEGTELQLAAELLDVADDQELEQFLGSFINSVGQAIHKAVNSPIGKAVGGVLKSTAKVALPIAGRAVGTFFGGPIGGYVGSTLASAASNALGLELEGLSPEDREFETAKQFIRFASATAKNAIEAPPGDPGTIAHRAALNAARVYAPGLMNIAAKETDADGSKRNSGQWIRRQGRIILLGV
jgi:hypothetical protein